MTRLNIEDSVLRRIGEVAAERGVEIYVVGGYVRDQVLGTETSDIDFSVVGDGIAFARVIHDELSTSRVFTYERFGTAGLHIDGRKIEFVGTRQEVYEENSRKPTVRTGSIEDDLRRRDFTVNAMAVSILPESYGALLDPYDGMGDIERKILRTPLEAAHTFSEDPLRMMRAFRFAAQLGFRVASPALQAVREMQDRIAIVSIERVRDEFMRTMMTPKPSVGLAPMMETGLLKHFFPELHSLAGVDQRSVEYPDGVKNFHHKDVFYHTLKVLDNLSELSDNIWLRFGALLHDIAKPRTKEFQEGTGWTFHGHPEIGARMVTGIFRRLRMPMDHIGYVKKMVILHLRPITLINETVTDSAIRRLLVDAGEDLEDLLMLCRSDITSKNPRLVKRYLKNYDKLVGVMREVEERDQLRNWQPPLDGKMIMELCGIRPGIAVGILKTRIEDAVLDGIIPNERDAAVAYLEKIKDEVLEGPLRKSRDTRKKILHRLPDNLKP